MQVKIKTYLQCHHCHEIFFFPEIYKGRIKLIKCQNCERKSTLIIWPSEEVFEVLNYISNFDTSSKHFKNISIVFLCSVLELLLENTLVIIIWQELMPEAYNIIDSLLEGYQGRSRMLMLYNKLGYGRFKEHLREIKKYDFLKNWDILVEERNKIVHGKLKQKKSYNSKKISIRFIRKQIDESLKVFSALNNYLFREYLNRDYV